MKVCPMTVQKTSKDLTHLINSDEIIMDVLSQSIEYLKLNDEFADKIRKTLWVFQSLEDLVPQPLEKIMTGHMFPIAEANFELENSIELCKLGFYKHALIALRNVLELGLLAIYWDIDDKSHFNIQKWLYSFENTPFKNTVFKKLMTNENIERFDKTHNLFNDINILFGQLSNFVHTKGRLYSSNDLVNANFNRFNEKSFLTWLKFMEKTVQYVVIVHILKYPVALQHTPCDQKFGLNGPVGLFLEPRQSEEIKQFLDGKILKTLQEISDNDPEALSLVEWVDKQPDISKEELEAQVKEFEKKYPTKTKA